MSRHPCSSPSPRPAQGSGIRRCRRGLVAVRRAVARALPRTGLRTGLDDQPGLCRRSPAAPTTSRHGCSRPAPTDPTGPGTDLVPAGQRAPSDRQTRAHCPPSPATRPSRPPQEPSDGHRHWCRDWRAHPAGCAPRRSWCDCVRGVLLRRRSVRLSRRRSACTRGLLRGCTASSVSSISGEQLIYRGPRNGWTASARRLARRRGRNHFVPWPSWYCSTPR